ncbi:MAG: rhamnulokinase family protein [bacterium]|nr:rhamnulokinase family protein [bacterium]
MGKSKNYIAVDLGAESGRLTLGKFEGKKIVLEEKHRFATGGTRLNNTLYWGAINFFNEIKKGLQKCSKSKISAIAFDSWGVDFGLIDKNNHLLENPVHYRDKRTDGMMEECFKKLSREEVFEGTGIQFMQINTLYQLLWMRINQPHLLQSSDCLLPIAALFTYFFSGEKAAEFTLATTTQCYDPRKNRWSGEILERLDIPCKIMPRIVNPGTVIGKLLPSISCELGISQIPLIATASHDTAAAVAAVPAQGNNWAFLSSGTWSLMGCEISSPLINKEVLKNNFTNEGGVNNTFRFLKNIMGLWLVQECKRNWESNGTKLPYPALTKEAEKAKAFLCFIDPEDATFLKPGNMPEKIQNYCRKTNQKVPSDRGSILRCVMESLAFKYRQVLEKLEEMRQRKIDVLHIVGGGIQNKLLCQLTANATKKHIIAGPVEATATGNILIQAIATGELSSVKQAREIVRNSFELIRYEPEQTDIWEEAYERYKNHKSKT